MPASRVAKVVSGGQTGVDRAALDVAAECGLPRGGWCPRGRKAEDGRLSDGYPLVETPTGRYSERTRWNVRDSDGTLVLAVGEPTGGTALTIRAAEQSGKPVRLIDPNDPGGIADAIAWIRSEAIETLNVAGPRESGSPGIYATATEFLRELFRRLEDVTLR